ncbi:6-phospho-beta-glucosidase [Propionibacteriaceae bacterium Y1923]|uniref:family 4 glycosyl hydrolase n=1 Tax=Aestuariimicrobium sp. Y1814 TaxID=3418742 RepID=UPI003C171F19
MKLTLLGGGGFRVPLVYRALMADTLPGRVTEVRLHDTDRLRLRAITQVLAELADGAPDAPLVVSTTDLGRALDGTDFVFSAVRVGGTAARATDERICLDHHIIGQETVGAGGISYALRSIPVALDFVDTVKAHAPDAWVINFTNPAGVITQVMRHGRDGNGLGERVIGICDSPVGLARRALGALQLGGLVPDDLGPVGTGATGPTGPAGTTAEPRVRLDYLGLNHLGWLRGLHVDGTDVLPLLLERADLLETFEEGRLFGTPLLQTLGAIPNEYLHFYYFTREALAADLHAAAPRGAYLQEQQGRFYDAVAALGGAPGAHALWEATRLDREQTYMASNREAAGSFERDQADLQTGGYDQVALAIMGAIANDRPAELVLNVANRGTIAGLADDDVIEVPCRVDGDGVHPLPVDDLWPHARGIVTNAKYVENTTITAALTRSRRHALLALLHHPLVASYPLACQVLDDLVAHHPPLADFAEVPNH